MWDLVVIGAGITGAGIARDAAMRGLQVLVIEARDIGSGTSSRSSRLIHGGLRYLEQAQLGLVFEAIRERQRLIELASHLVRPQRFMLSTYRGDRVGPLRLRLGLGLYDALGGWRSRPHQFLSAERALAAEPMLNPTLLRGAVTYDDAVTDDFRLTLTVLQDARRHGAEVITYAPATAIHATDGNHRVEVGELGSVMARQVIVAAGPWTSSRLLGRAAEGLLALSKGIHLVLRSSDLPVSQPVVFQVPGGPRLMFVVPWGTRTYLGTSDDPYEGDPADCGSTQQEERTLLEMARRWLPHARLDPGSVVSAWAGVRPLVHAGNSGATAALSRSHRIVQDQTGIIGVVGGKLTTYRAMAQESVDLVCKRLSRRDPARTYLACTTHTTPLVPGAPLSPEELQDPLVRDLSFRHGPNSRALADLARSQPGHADRIAEDLPYRWIELVHAIAAEGCTHLDDVLRRRIPLAITDIHLGAAVAETVARWLVDAKGGDGQDVQEELDRYCLVVQRETGRRVRLPPRVPAAQLAQPTQPRVRAR